MLSVEVSSTAGCSASAADPDVRLFSPSVPSAACSVFSVVSVLSSFTGSSMDSSGFSSAGVSTISGSVIICSSVVGCVSALGTSSTSTVSFWINTLPFSEPPIETVASSVQSVSHKESVAIHLSVTDLSVF